MRTETQDPRMSQRASAPRERDREANPPEGERARAPGQAGTEPAELNPQAVRENMQVPPELEEALDRIIVAGKRVMFSDETAGMVEQALAGEGPIEDKLAEAITGLMGLLWEQSNQTMPPMLIIPAGLVLLAEAVDFLTGAGEQVSTEQYGTAIERTVNQILGMFGADEQMLEQELGGQPGAEEAMPPGRGQAPEPSGRGVLGGAMGG